LKIDRTT